MKGQPVRQVRGVASEETLLYVGAGYEPLVTAKCSRELRGLRRPVQEISQINAALCICRITLVFVTDNTLPSST